MKFLLGLTVVALAAVGCGQKGNQDRSVPAQPPASASVTKSLDTDLATVPGTNKSYAEENAAIEASLASEPQPVQVPTDALSAGERIAHDEAMLATLNNAFNNAKAARDNTLHLPYAFFDASLYSAASGYFGYDGVMGLRNIYSEKLKKLFVAAKKKTPQERAVATRLAKKEATEEEVGLLSRIGSTTAEVSTEYVGPIAFRGLETAAAIYAGIYAIGKVEVLGDELKIKINGTPAMAYYQNQIKQTQANLDKAREDLNAVNYGTNTRTATP
jgi:hypothetical protein